ncbi:MAG TPA: hypothetical protein VJP85_08040 [Candidatus Baltobacteraceae bacterium]|nr:hypothetical protein [Candidatus Baltobacteraceae bacterium]
MKEIKPNPPARVRLSKASEQKLQERSAVLYTRELERWNKRPLRPD